MTKLAACLIDGVGVARDPAEAVLWLRRAVDKGDVSAMTELGICLDTGLGVAKNTAEASGLLIDAADAGHPAAEMHFALFYESSPAEALSLYRSAIEAGPSVLFANEDFYRDVCNITGSHEWALAWCRAANAGARHDRRMQSYVASDEARALLEFASLPGFGTIIVEKITDFLEREEWGALAAFDDFLRRVSLQASQQQDTAAGVGSATRSLTTAVSSAVGGSELASSHDGTHVTIRRAMEQAIAQYHRAADTGDVRNQFNLVLRAAEAGDVSAQYTLGLIYAEGSGVECDPEQAAAWFERAANNGYIAAQYRLACCLCNGLGVPVSRYLAQHWWERAASAGCAASQFRFSRCYASGLALCPPDGLGPRDPELAVHWCRLAAAAGYPGAQSQLDNYEAEWGVPVNNFEIASFCSHRRAARTRSAVFGTDDVVAQYKVAEGYRLGRGVGQSDSEAITWYTRAATANCFSYLQEYASKARIALAEYYGRDVSGCSLGVSESKGSC
jgi:TPR repeat protein